MRSRRFLLVFLAVLLAASAHYSGAEAYVNVKPYEPQFIDEGEILQGSFEEFRCTLEAGHRYHVFLVGDWISNKTEATDYDVEVRDPDGSPVSVNTESAGLPEQVSNDPRQRYFVPAKSGVYTFKVYNDPRDSMGAEAAVFMIIEHIEVNKRYRVYLEGKPYVGAEYPDEAKIAYEFNTSSPYFLLNIEVPDPDPSSKYSGLDMYEARVYPMANPTAEVGYSLRGLGVPEGELLQGDEPQGQYGGYNFNIDGFRFPSLRLSCETAGADMRSLMYAPFYNESKEDQGEENVFYYLVLMAEYYHGELEFYIKTDFRDVNLSLAQPLEPVYAGEETEVAVDTQTAVEVSRVWLEYTLDGEEWESVELKRQGGLWRGELPPLPVGAQVEYRVRALDEVDNKGLLEGGFTVRRRVELELETLDVLYQGGEEVSIEGWASEPGLPLTFHVDHQGKVKKYETTSGVDGGVSLRLTPAKTGVYRVWLEYAGDEEHHPSTSEAQLFQVDRRRMSLVASVNKAQVKLGEPVRVQGYITPRIPGIQVGVILVSPTGGQTLQVLTDGEGRFSLEATPDALGEWQVLAQIQGGELYESAQAPLQSFQVLPLTMVDKVANAAMGLVKPPRVYAVGVLALGGGALAYRRLREARAEKEGEEGEEEEEPEVTSYRRRKKKEG